VVWQVFYGVQHLDRLFLQADSQEGREEGRQTRITKVKLKLRRRVFARCPSRYPNYCTATSGLQHITSISPLSLSLNLRCSAAHSHPIFLSSYTTYLDIHHSLPFSACSFITTHNYLPSPHVLYLSAYPCPTSHPVTRFVRDSPQPTLPLHTALQHITSIIIIAVSPALILRCLTSPLPHPPPSYSSIQPTHSSNTRPALQGPL